jgi:hypothetical protein
MKELYFARDVDPAQLGNRVVNLVPVDDIETPVCSVTAYTRTTITQLPFCSRVSGASRNHFSGTGLAAKAKH